MTWAGYVARMENTNAYSVLAGKVEGKSPLVCPRRRWEDDIIMDLKIMGWDGVD